MLSVVQPQETGHGPRLDQDIAHQTQSIKQINSSQTVLPPRTIDELMRIQVDVNPNDPVVSYPSSGVSYVDYSVRQLDTFAYRVAQQYAHDFPPRISSSEKVAVVALLGISDFDYIITLLALTKLGHTVLLLSPRISQPAYAHLLKTTGSRRLIIQPSFREKAAALQNDFPDLHVREIVVQASYGCPVAETGNTNMTPGLDLNKEVFQSAWIFHSSGSTGLPKPVYLTHRAALENYMRNMDRLGLRSFLTLPLFHTHGISSLFRAIITGKQIHIYNASLPLTKQHLISCMREHEFDIFCAVPYALKVLSESPEGVELLARFKLVTFGGSPCPDALGDELTSKGVKLITIYGMSETGPLMTSLRPDGDDGWNYLRPSAQAQKFLRFEERGEGVYELVVLDGWPSKSGSNRPDGSYATRDLFIKHPSLTHAWKYSGRIDDVIVLENGEKANPLPVEGAVRQNELVTEAVVFGAGKSHFGIMVILSQDAAQFSRDEVIDKLFPVIEDAQALLPAYAKVSRDMVILLNSDTTYPKTDKGTIIRNAFYARFSKEIEESYVDKVSASTKTFSKPELREFIRSEAIRILGLKDASSLPDDQDFFEAGMDSLQASQLRGSLAKNVDMKGQTLTLNIVFDYPSVNTLAHTLYLAQLGSATTSVSIEEEMGNLIEKYGNFERHIPRPRNSEGHYAVITGATGSLGAHLLAKLAQLEDVKTICCLVRAGSEKEASTRVIRSLRARKVHHTLSLLHRRKIVCLPSDLSLPSLGLAPKTYAQIANQITALYHCAWTVNFNLRLSSFEKDCIAGVKNLIGLCLKSQGETPARFTFCSSIGTVLRMKGGTVPEALPADFSCSQPTGYAQSKLVAEHICHNAITQTGIQAYIIRVGQIIGDTKHGVWNSSEAIPLMLQTARTIGTLPSIDESLRWLPVDVVAQSMIEIANNNNNSDAVSGGIFNLINPRTFHWTRDLLPYLQQAGLDFKVLDPPAWLNLLRQSSTDPVENPPIKLLEYLTSNYDTTAPRRVLDFQTENMQRLSKTFESAPAPDAQLVGKIVTYFTSSCWDNNGPAEVAATEGSQKSFIVVCGPDSTQTSAIATYLSSQLTLPLFRGNQWIENQEADGRSNALIIDGGAFTKHDRDHIRNNLHFRLLLLLQDEESVESDLGPTDDEVDVLPLDATMAHSELLEETEGWARDFLRGDL
ncbi:hypothetical protein VTN00DRAFT_5774 [Thermoascus crustaceus]|uniref:uncharacterized protein n=1 Tax=Thermoascus crustaceus TaxID=5088 RepID=UPI00374452CF